VRLHRDLKSVAPSSTRFVNVTVQIDDAICEVKLTVSEFSFSERAGHSLVDGNEM